MEELLKIAKEKYPVGTVFKSAFNPNRKGKVTHLNFFVENKNIFTDQLLIKSFLLKTFLELLLLLNLLEKLKSSYIFKFRFHFFYFLL